MTIGTVALLLPGVGGVVAVVSLTGGEDTRTTDRYASVATSGSPKAGTPTGGSALAAVPGTTGGTARLGGPPGLPAVAADPAVGMVGIVPGATAPLGVPPLAVPPLAVPPLGVPTFGAEMPIGGTPVDPTTEYEPTETPPPPTQPQPVVETTTVTETEPIPFDTRYVRDRSMPRGSYDVRTPGEQGVRSLTYEVTTTDGQQTGKRLIAESVTQEPVTRVVAVGTGPRCGDDGGDLNDRIGKRTTCGSTEGG